MRLFDAHCHLQDERLRPLLGPAMERAAAAGVRRLMCCGSSESDWPDVASIARANPSVLPSFGLHPWYVDQRSPEWDASLLAALEEPRSAVGEIGLDHALEHRDDRAQESVFLRQLEIARALHRPASIHCRRAWERMVEILGEFGPHDAGLVIHSYSGAAELIDDLAALNVHFSFSGSVTRTNNARGRRAAAAVPEDRLLIETDAPDIPPPHPAVPFQTDAQGKPINEPANLVCVLQTVAELRGRTVEDIAQSTWANACRLFLAAGADEA